MSQSDPEKSLGDDATFAGQPKSSRPDAEMSLGDERTLGGGLSGQETIIDDIKVVDLEARYRIEGTLGQGGMGAVLLATDTLLGRKVAIKRILGEAAGNRLAVTRFLTEAKAIAAVNHPNIVQIHDYGRAEDGPFLIMEYVDGGSLLDKCRVGPIPLEEAIDLACQLCDGLAKAHDLGIIHRDIKPANVLLTNDGVPKLTDFGLAKAQAGDHGQTMTGAVLGTPDFMPPEQRRDAAEVDHRSDLWSLAATLYQAVTGRSPKVIRLHELPQPLQPVMGKALEDDKDARYQSARDFRESLRAATGKPSVSVASSTASAETGTREGQCTACGEVNDATRKFCRACGGPLVASCLSCHQPMRLWEEICGDCGGRQTQLLDRNRQDFAAVQNKAQALLEMLQFTGAKSLVEPLVEETHPRLSFIKTWVDAFLMQVDNVRAQHVAQAVDAVREAVAHEAQHDYAAAVSALQSVPVAMHAVPLPGCRETCDVVLERVRCKQVECQRLLTTIKDRIRRKDITDLEADVDRLLELVPERSDLVRLKSQLVERQRQLVIKRDAAMAEARRLLAGHAYPEALAALESVPPSLNTADVSRLQRECESLVVECRNIREKIRYGVTAQQFDGLLPLVERLLVLVPGDVDAEQVRALLLTRKQQFVRVRAEANELWRACRFADAAAVIEKVANCRLPQDVATRLDHCRSMAALRSTAMEHVVIPESPERLPSLGQECEMYRQQLVHFGLQDASFSEGYTRATSAVEAALASVTKNDGAAPGVVIQIMEQLAADTPVGILPRPLSSVTVPIRIACILGDALQAELGRSCRNGRFDRLKQLLRRCLDEAAAELSDDAFEVLLAESDVCKDFYDPQPGVFGNRITSFVRAFHQRSEDVCESPRLITLASTWAHCTCNSDELHVQLKAWKKLLSWFAIFNRRGGSKIPFAGYWTPPDKGNVRVELRSILRDIVPDSDGAAVMLHRNLLTTILSTYRERGWLPPPDKGVFGFVAKSDGLLEFIDHIVRR